MIDAMKEEMTLLRKMAMQERARFLAISEEIVCLIASSEWTEAREDELHAAADRHYAEYKRLMNERGRISWDVWTMENTGGENEAAYIMKPVYSEEANEDGTYEILRYVKEYV